MKVCLTPNVHGTGGMVSFAAKFAAGLHQRGIETTGDLLARDVDAVLVIGGTRNLPGLWRARRRGIPIIQRLNGMNWVHRVRRTGIRHFLRAEYGNRILSTIRARLATGIVYQSRFSKDWWERVYGPTGVRNSVVYNGVDLAVYNPQPADESVSAAKAPAPGAWQHQPEKFRVLMVEASLAGGYEIGLESGIALAERLLAHFPIELMVVGKVAPALQTQWQARATVPILWAGRVAREQIPALDRAAHLFYAADLHPACPNSVIEALACGLPVAAFDTGALPEIVSGDSGCIVPYGSDPWKIQSPDIPTLAEAAAAVLGSQPRFRARARARAEAAFGLDRMLDGYIAMLCQ
ncbi:MAG: glycosyltransferase family 4 protein [Chloroflexota bacterium]